jgi:flagellar protein FliS
MYPNAAHAYQAQQVRASSKVKQVALLYDRMIGSLHEAIQAIADKDIEKRHNSNRRAQEIILALYAALDVDVGGDVARNLQMLYQFALRRLPQVDLKNDPKPAREVIEVLDPIRKSWHELARREAAGTLYDAEVDENGKPIPRDVDQQGAAAQGLPASETAPPPKANELPTGGIDLKG